MPRRPKMPEPRTKDYLFSKTLDGVPTPWINTGQVIDGVPVQIKFRLWIRRRGRTLHVETHADSPNYPGKQLPVSITQRQGLFELYSAGVMLVRLAKRDPTSVPAHPRFVWDRSDPKYLERVDLATTVCKGLHRLLNPKRGRPRNEIVGDVVRPGRPLGMRMARRKELLAYTEKLIDLSDPMMDRVNDAVRMRGYEKPQRDEISSLVGAIYRYTKQLRALVFNDKFVPSSQPMPSAADVLGLDRQSEISDSHTPAPLAPETFTLDDVSMPEPTRPKFEIDLSVLDK